ncbi:RNA polymerase sigma-70 factor (ECF subfamily) [Asanoa ferruginea]|uniref:RNA polymerase sigma-70 factor (ECF subfamily) n=1 Tax=Asanoa ferruginea TaxID=53367 RepID=A0A3D9ZFP5_9ACTN|nr:sigma-70 family RNA polymerase sigma factor [Asanoa ferruginea]REF96248.1 RNA polymerase sigma-70 factor (ECF subfamily) [Asanoa ferruginea]GIF46898.1 RNA polymerase sigma factor [Asanoa ferruginea]
METVVRVAKPGVSASFDEFYAANVHRLMLQLYAYTADVGAAQDAVQEAFTRAWARWDRVADYDEPAAWVRRVALNVANNRWRRVRAARAHAGYHREEVVAEPSPDRVALARALRSLPEKHRRAIVLFHIADLAIAEIAAQEGVAEGTVKAWLHRGRTALATLLTEDEEGHHD